MSEPESTEIPRISFQLPGSIHRAIGIAIVQFSRFETTVERMIWDFTKLEFDDGKLIISPLPTTRKTQILRDILDRKCPSTAKHRLTKAVWNTVETVTTIRNSIAHGWWIINEGVPGVFSHRWRDEPGKMQWEAISYERIHAVARLSTHLEKRFRLLWMELKPQSIQPQPAQNWSYSHHIRSEWIRFSSTHQTQPQSFEG